MVVCVVVVVVCGLVWCCDGVCSGVVLVMVYGLVVCGLMWCMLWCCGGSEWYAVW